MVSSVERLNALSATELDAALRRCLDVPRWAKTLASGLPYASAEALLSSADELSASLSDEEVRTALADHPRIGERASDTSPTSAMSRAEQSGVDERLADRLRTANREYEQRFGHIYLVCASGRGGEELLGDLTARMRNDPETEISVVRHELGKIARLRLASVLAG